jgi:predicted nucleotidyltransferase component of viral defense system
VIPKAEILAVAAEAGLLPTTVEKDYALGWVLFAIADHPDLSRWYFKGGTCLKKCFFDTYRFSEDLDFTVPEGGSYDGDAIRASLLAVADWVRDHSGIDFPGDGIHVAESINKRGRLTFEARMSFLGPLQLPRSARQRIRFDLTRDELIADEAEEREVFHGYSDAIEPPPSVRCYSLSEILAEEVRALYERSGRARDVYDVVNVGRNLREELSPNKIAVLAAKKFLSVGAAKRSGERSPATIPPTRGDGDDCSGDRSRGRPGTGVHVRMARRNEAGAPCTAPADRVGVADRRRRLGRGAHRAADAAALRLERSGIGSRSVEGDASVGVSPCAPPPGGGSRCSSGSDRSP